MRRPFTTLRGAFRSHLLDVLVALFVGAIATTLIAWSIALEAEPAVQTAGAASAWPAPAPADWPTHPREVIEYSATSLGGGLRQWNAAATDERLKLDDVRMFVSRAGWPVLAMESRLHKTVGGPGWSTNPVQYDDADGFSAGVTVPLYRARPHLAGLQGWGARRLPLRPVPMGFLADTACWGAITLAFIWLWRSHPRWRRGARWRELALVLCLGLAANALVALGLWARWQLATPTRERDLDPRLFRGCEASFLGLHARWPAAAPSTWPDAPGSIQWCSGAGKVRLFHLTSGPYSMHVVQTGWPLPVLQSEELDELVSAGPSVREGGIWDAQLPGAPPSTQLWDPMPIIPVRPIAMGAVANTMLFSATAAMIVWTASAVRWRLRRRAGRCEQCGYDARGLAVCPECGGAAGRVAKDAARPA